jgi:hypothetical protein
MDASEQINELAAALAKAQGAITPAKFDGQNPHLKNRYTTLAAVWDVIRKPLSENGLAVVQVVTTEVDGMFLLTRLMHSSGQFVQAVYPITAGDNRGVSSAQAVGSALTYARRYSLTALVGVVSDDDDDGNSAAQVQQARRPQQPTEQPKPAPAGNGQQAQDPPGFAVWADWRNANDAKAWAMTQGRFNGQQHMERGYEKCKAECKPANAHAMWVCWYEYVTAHEPAKVQPPRDSEPVDMDPPTVGDWLDG